LKNCLANISADLSAIDIEGSDNLHIAGQVPAQIPVHQPLGLHITMLPIEMDPLDQRTGTVANTDNGCPNRSHQLSPAR
jgi:hypothetical protein